jgi:ATP-binding cassette subfamily C protein
MIVMMNPSLALMIFGIGFVFTMLVAKVLLPLFYRWGQSQQEAALYSNQNLYQFFHAFKEMVLLNKSVFFVDAYKQHSYKRSMTQAVQAATNALPRMVIEVLFLGLFVSTIVFLCLRNETPAQMFGILSGYLYVGFRLMPGLNRIINYLNNFKSIISSVDRVYEECATVTMRQSYLDVPDFSFNQNITLNNVGFKYLNTETNSLKNIDLTINKGECVGIIGETGSGKSTLVDVVLGLLKPYEGSVLIDGQFPVNSHQWHNEIGYVPQAIYLTDDTIEANIAFGEKNVDQDRLLKAVRAAQLEKFIDNLPQGLKTMVGERGVRISGGERQRISIARALYREPEILIFDEATSALDNQTEAQLIETIHAVSRNRTVIMIAHRLTTLSGCDRIVEMNGGAIQKITNYETIAGLNRSYA